MGTIRINIWWDPCWTYTIKDFMAYIDENFDIASYKQRESTNYDIFITVENNFDISELLKELKINFPGKVNFTYLGTVI